MVARHYYRYDQDDPVAEVPTVLRWGYTLGEKAEEGEAATIEVVVDDPDMTLDFVGHRRWLVFEDDSDDEDNEVIFSGLTQSVTIAHKGGDIKNPDGRVWVIEIADMNTLWTYRVMRGSDTDRPAETDVERMTWLAETEEFGYFGSLPLLSSGNPVNMDEQDVRGMTTGAVADSCAQQSGKNWWIGSRGLIADVPSSVEIFLWYGKDALSVYASPLSLSNDPADLDMAAVNAGTALVYPIGADTALRRDYRRQYSGAYGEYRDGAAYVEDPVTAELITVTKRDMSYPAPDVKTATTMKARLRRVLRDHRGPDEVISTTVTLPGNKVSQLRAGMRVDFKATHEPGYEDFVTLRVLTAKPSPVGRKANHDVYSVALELQGPGIGGGGTCSTVIATAATDEATGLESGGTTAAVTSVIPDDGYLFGMLIGVNQNAPNATGMGTASGYTSLYGADNSDGTWRISGKSASAGSHTMSASFTPGFASAGVWLAAQTWFASSLTFVQQEEDLDSASAVFDNPVTTGNIVLMIAVRTGIGGGGGVPDTVPGGTSGGPATGWTTMWNVDRHNGNSWAQIVCWARCADPDDGETYDWDSDGAGPASCNTYIFEVSL